MKKEQRPMLARMETVHAETVRHLAVIERQIEARAERMTTSSRVKARQFGRASATWSRIDERDPFRPTSRRFASRGAARSTRCPASWRGRPEPSRHTAFATGSTNRQGRACHDAALPPHRSPDPR
jgi:hypothetical protein